MDGRARISIPAGIRGIRDQDISGASCDCNIEFWNSYDSIEMYKSCLRGPHYYVQGELAKARFMTIENMLLHYLIVYVLVEQNTNHAQPTDNVLKLMIFISHVLSMLGLTQEDYQTNVEISNEEDNVILVEQTQESQPNKAPNMSQAPYSGLAHGCYGTMP
ncbi:hypothetical protein Lal_00042421 [Lupinus albus]|nr:hypothetical protein Lal_00042421 [Lupinus albus]